MEEKILRSGGFSLTSALAAAGAVGGLAVVGFALSNQLMTTQFNAVSAVDRLSFQSEISLMLSKGGDYCAYKSVDTDNQEILLNSIQGLGRTIQEGPSHERIQVTKLAISPNPYSEFSDWKDDSGNNDSSQTFLGELKVTVSEKRKSVIGSNEATKELTLSFPSSFSMNKSSEGALSITSCSSLWEGGQENIPPPKTFLVLHSQSTSIPDCPDGSWESESTGHSAVLYSLKNITTGNSILSSNQDLSSPGSCVDSNIFSYFLEYSNKQAAGVDSIDTHMTNRHGHSALWLAADSTHASRCRVCSKRGATIRVVYNQFSDTPPECPNDGTALWSGHNILGISGRDGFYASQDMGKSGACLRRKTWPLFHQRTGYISWDPRDPANHAIGLRRGASSRPLPCTVCEE